MLSGAGGGAGLRGARGGPGIGMRLEADDIARGPGSPKPLLKPLKPLTEPEGICRPPGWKGEGHGAAVS